MTQLSRRDAVNGMSALTLGALMGRSTDANLDAKERVRFPQRELFAVGPYRVGQLYKHRIRRKSDDDDDFLKAAAITTQQFVEALDEASLYVIDRRIWNSSNDVQLADYGEGYPVPVLAGKLLHQWKDGDYKFGLREVKLADRQTVSERNSAQRIIRFINLTCEICEITALGVHERVATFLLDRPVRYGVNEKT